MYIYYNVLFLVLQVRQILDISNNYCLQILTHWLIGAYAWLGKTWIKTPLQRRDCIIVLLRKKVIKQAVRGAKQDFEILVIPNQYKDTLDDLVDSSDLEHPKMLRPNSQKQSNSTPNLGDNDNLLVRQEEYRKERGVKGSKACKRHWDGRGEQVRGDCMSEVRVRHVLQ